MDDTSRIEQTTRYRPYRDRIRPLMPCILPYLPPGPVSFPACLPTPFTTTLACGCVLVSTACVPPCPVPTPLPHRTAPHRTPPHISPLHRFLTYMINLGLIFNSILWGRMEIDIFFFLARAAANATRSVYGLARRRRWPT